MGELPLSLRLLIWGASYYGAALLGATMEQQSSGFLLFWPPSGLFVAVLLRTATREWWPLVLVAIPCALVADMQRGISLWSGLAFGLCDVAAALSGAWLVRRYVARDPALQTTREVVLTLALASAASVLPAAVGALVQTGFTTNLIEWLIRWREHWVADVLGILLVAPLVLTWQRARPPVPMRPSRMAEATALALAAALSALLLVRSLSSPSTPRYYALTPCLIWAALRFGLQGAAWVGLLFGLAIITATSRDNYLAVIQEMRLSTLVLTSTGLLLAAALEERRHAQEVKERSARRLTDAVLTITDLANTPLQILVLQTRALLERTDFGAQEELTRIDRAVKHLCALSASAGRFREHIETDGESPESWIASCSNIDDGPRLRRS